MNITETVGILTELEIGRPRTVHNLIVVPISGNRASPLDYFLLDDPVIGEKTAIEEVSEPGIIPELRFFNFLNQFVLVVDGMELVGGRKYRIVDASFLIPPESLAKIPVSSVEGGKGHHLRQEFRLSRRFSPHWVRRENAAFQMIRLREKSGRDPDQGKVREFFEMISGQKRGPTAARSMTKILEEKQSSIDEYNVCLTLEGTESGAAYFVNGTFQGIELFDKASTFRKMCRKVVSGIAVDAMANRGESPYSTQLRYPDDAKKYVRQVLEEARRSTYERYDPVAAGEDWRYDAKLSFGKALQYGPDLIQFSAFGK